MGKGGIIGLPNEPTTSVASGVWSLREHFRAINDASWPPAPTPASAELPWLGESANLGTPTIDVSGAINFPYTTAVTWNGLTDYTIAVDFPSGITSTDTGIIFEIGGSASGTIIVMESGTIYIGSSGFATASTDFSSYVDTPGTLYFTIDYNVASKTQLYWWDGFTWTQLIITTTTSDGAGTSGIGVGTSNSSTWNIGTANDTANFTGSIDGFREWNTVSFDFSTL